MSTEKLNALQPGMDSKPAGQGTIPLGVDESRTPQIPEQLSILPVRSFVVFPGTVIPLMFSGRRRLNCSMTLCRKRR